MNDQLKAWILNKMKRHRFIGGIKNIRKGAPQSAYSEIDDLVKGLIKEGFILVKIAAYGRHVSLNPRLMKEVDEFIQKHYTEFVFK